MASTRCHILALEPQRKPFDLARRNRTPSDPNAEPPAKAKLNRDGFRQFNRVAPYLRPHRLKFAVGIVLITVSGILTLLVTRLWGQLGGVGVDASSGQGEFELPLPIDAGDLKQIGIAIFMVLVLQSALSFIRIWLFGEITTRMLKALREDAFASMITQPMAFFDNRRVGDLGSRIAADIEAIRDTFTVVLAELIRQSIIIGGGLLALMTFSWKLTLLMLIACPVTYYDVIEPCFKCYDFEGVVAHELGHVLGFGHVDQSFVDNLYRPIGTVTGAETCKSAALEIPAFLADEGDELVGVAARRARGVDALDEPCGLRAAQCRAAESQAVAGNVVDGGHGVSA